MPPRIATKEEIDTALASAETAIFLAEIEKAKACLVQKTQEHGPLMYGCTSFVQRTLGVGYMRAMVIIDTLQDTGFISPMGDGQAGARGARHLLPKGPRP